MRYRLTFAKTEAMRFTGHLDLHHTLERTFRRAGLPLAYSQGYNPRPKINLASALPLGLTSRCEIADFWLSADMSIETILNRLEPALPPGVQIETISSVDLREPSLQSELRASEFRITFLEPIPDLPDRCEALLGAQQLLRERRNKTYDLRPLIEELRLLDEDEFGHQCLFTRLTASEGATGRPEELVKALGALPEDTYIERTQLIFKAGNENPKVTNITSD